MIKIKKVFIAFLFLLCGCRNYQELNTLNIITEIGIIEAKGKYTIVLKEVSKNDENRLSNYQYRYYHATSNSIANAQKKIQNNSQNKMYLDKLQSIIINKKKISQEIKRFIKYHKDSKIYYSKNPEEVIRYQEHFNYLGNLKTRTNTFNYLKKYKHIKTYKLIYHNKKLSKKPISFN